MRTAQPEWRTAMNIQTERLALFIAVSLPLLAADPALAASVGSGNIFGTGNPLQALADFMTGPFAYVVVLLALLAAGATLAYGGDFSGYSRRFLLVAAAGAFVIFAEQVVGRLFTGAGFDVPHGMALQAWPWPGTPEAGP
ncbi:MAG: hypothetical protein F4213_18690 [Boseongicola sp. SB0677_bin_26]|nr:hypothetical protein [Boseongicola sp. SB0665_bin_10]MYG28018.1 hypothetical protein [Boseongicola sp. SB0677_bin_26]